ncbi:MAG: CPBP family intramembrane glutamic endopeptidase [Pseudomonadota bacterium]
MWTPQFDDFVAPARRKPQLWRVLVGLLLTVAVYVVTIVLVLLVVFLLAGLDGLTAWMERIAATDTPTAVLLVMLTFAGMMIGPLLAAWLLHNRSARSVFGPRLLPNFAIGAGAVVAVFAAAGLLLPTPFDPQPNTPVNLFISFLPLAVAGLLLQTGAEEVLFRGYLQGQLAARFRSPLVWMLLPSVAFGALHYSPSIFGPNALLMAGIATILGLIFADLTRVTGNIGAAWGMHFVNNVTGVLVVSLNGHISGLSLWTTPFGPSDTEILRPLMLQDLLVSIIIWAVIRLWLAKRARPLRA